MATRDTRVHLSSGIALHVVEAGPTDAPPVILLHGFPESHRTWRGIVPLLEDRFRLIMPDQRGYGASDRPQDVGEYRSETLIDDIFALAEALGLDEFALVGHDWGGAIAWGAALRGNERLNRLAIVNAPHPVIFQKSLIEDSAQRAAAQYISALRSPGIEQYIRGQGLDWLFDKTFASVDPERRPSNAEKQLYIADWSRPGALEAMIHWYRASKMIVPPPGVTVPLPDFLLGAFPSIRIPTLVIWGMRDPALLPIQLDGLDRLVDGLTIVRLPDAGHFAPWEKPDEVARALLGFL